MSVTKHIVREVLRHTCTGALDENDAARILEGDERELARWAALLDDNARRAMSMESAREHALVLEAERETRTGLYGGGSWRVYFDDDARSWVAERRRKIGDGECEREATVCPDEESARYMALTGQKPRWFVQ